MRDALTILDTMDDPALFGPWFKRRDDWQAWRAFLCALFGLPMTTEQRAIYTRHTGRGNYTTCQAHEAWLIIGRRGGKSFVCALIAVYLAAFRSYKAHLSPGERAVVMVIAADRMQARVTFRYARALLSHVPMLSRMIVAERAESIELSNRCDLEIHTSSFRAVRGRTVAAVIADEIAFWSVEDSTSPDVEVLNAIRPAMATIPKALLIGLSSPYARRGVLWEAYRDHFGKDDDCLVWQADSRSMNPTLPQSVIDRAYADDTASAAAEFGAEFRSDISGFMQEQWIESAVDERCFERPPVPGVSYCAFADPSGGGHDSFTLCISHREGDTVVLDVMHARRPPFQPEAVVADYCATLKRYGLTRVCGDRYSLGWVVESFERHGIVYDNDVPAKSEIYLSSEPLFAQGRVRLLDHRVMLSELRQLERRTQSGGRDSVDHPPRGHDDCANACAGALWLSSQRVVCEIAEKHFVLILRDDNRARRDTEFVARCEVEALRDYH
jgi:hypothetical protein